jgi:protein-tyrosine-phosphatase/predicted ATP-grasp superfamily ATP-dependent carboligase
MALMAFSNDVLVLDGDKIAALDIVRELGRSGLSVAVAASRRNALAFGSRFAGRRELYPDPGESPAEFVAWLERSLVSDPVRLVIPVTDLTTLPVAEHIQRLRAHAAIAAESFENLQVVCDKLRTIELAGRLGVPVPRTAVVRSEAELDAGGRTFPVVCKPLRSSVWSDSGFRATSVWYGFDEAQFRTEAARSIATCPLLVQEYTRGNGVGLEVLARDGELLLVFQHRRLHELPLTGGGSTYRISEPPDPTLREYAARLMGALNWTGVAMIEFKVDADTGQAVLMEINGRFWGSLPLATRAGVPFAAELYNMLVLGRTPVQRPYRAGVRCRRLGSDVDWFKEMATLAVDDPRVRAGLVRRIPRRVLFAEAVRLLHPGERYDVQMWQDPVPAVRDLCALGAAQGGMIRRQAARMTAGSRAAWHRVRNARKAVRAVRVAQRTLFVCYGNIMRSAFAAEYYRHRVDASGQAAQVQSSGIYDVSGRPADPRMSAAAARRGIDLSAHRSRTVDAAAVAWADVILVMDRSHLDALRRRYPAAASKFFLLALLDPGSGREIEIPDPYLADESATERVCSRIITAIDGMLAVQRAARRATSRSLPKLSGQNGTI